MTRRAAATGLALAAVLVIVVLAGRGPGVRPLFDGFAPIPEYRFVAPPPAFAAGNHRPEGATIRIPITPRGSAARGVSTPDGQAVISLGAGAVPTHGADTAVRLTVTPRDGARLAPLPDGLRPNGNAYAITLHYEPSGAPVTSLARPGTLVLEVPEVSTGMFRSPPGRTWRAIDSRGLPPRQVQLSMRLDAPGNYLSGTNLPELPGPTGAASHSVLGGILVGVGALALVLAAFHLARRRRRRDPPATDLTAEEH